MGGAGTDGGSRAGSPCRGGASQLLRHQDSDSQSRPGSALPLLPPALLPSSLPPPRLPPHLPSGRSLFLLQCSDIPPIPAHCSERAGLATPLTPAHCSEMQGWQHLRPQLAAPSVQGWPPPSFWSWHRCPVEACRPPGLPALPQDPDSVPWSTCSSLTWTCSPALVHLPLQAVSSCRAGTICRVSTTPRQ